MVLKEVTQLTTEKEYETICKQYDDLKTHIQDAIEFEDFEVLSSYDITKIKELHFQKSALFWKIKVDEIESQRKAIRQANKFKYEHDVEYIKLSIKYWTYYGEQKQAELKAQGDFYSYNRHHKPVIQNKILEWKMSLENKQRWGDLELPKKVEVIP